MENNLKDNNLMDNKLVNTKIKHKTDLVDTVGKRENKRKHKHYMQVEDKYLRIGLNWKKQPFKGRPKINNMFMDMFKFTDEFLDVSLNNYNENVISKNVISQNVISQNENWGAILANARQYIKDNASEFYDNDKYVSIYGRFKKTGEWVEIVQFNTTDNKWLV